MSGALLVGGRAEVSFYVMFFFLAGIGQIGLKAT